MVTESLLTFLDSEAGLRVHLAHFQGGRQLLFQNSIFPKSNLPDFSSPTPSHALPLLCGTHPLQNSHVGQPTDDLVILGSLFSALSTSGIFGNTSQVDFLPSRHPHPRKHDALRSENVGKVNKSLIPEIYKTIIIFFT